MSHLITYSSTTKGKQYSSRDVCFVMTAESLHTLGLSRIRFSFILIAPCPLLIMVHKQLLFKNHRLSTSVVKINALQLCLGTKVFFSPWCLVLSMKSHFLLHDPSSVMVLCVESESFTLNLGYHGHRNI